MTRRSRPPSLALTRFTVPTKANEPPAKKV
jgi:hypothetical protein